MRLIDYRNICRRHMHEEGCVKCPGYEEENKSCLFCKPPHAWSNKEISSYIEKLKGELPHGSNGKRERS